MSLVSKDAHKAKAVVVPSNFEFLDPDQPEIRYESDLSDEARQRMAPGLDAMHKRAASGMRLGPPWTITLESCEQFTIPGPDTAADEPVE
jgi:hypothetical protein